MEERCVVCGTVIPEGRQVCQKCEAEQEHDERIIKETYPVSIEYDSLTGKEIENVKYYHPDGVV